LERQNYNQAVDLIPRERNWNNAKTKNVQSKRTL